VKKALRSILALHPDCSSDVLYGDTGLPPPGAFNRCRQSGVGSTIVNMGAGPIPAAVVPTVGSRSVGRPKVASDCAAVKSITEQIQHTLNIAKVTSPASGSTSHAQGNAVVAPQHSMPHASAWRWTHRTMTMSRRWKVVQREAVLNHLAHCTEPAAAHIRPVPGRQALLASRLLA
jgi:hypothetical protein